MRCVIVWLYETSKRNLTYLILFCLYCLLIVMTVCYIGTKDILGIEPQPLMVQERYEKKN